MPEAGDGVKENYVARGTLVGGAFFGGTLAERCSGHGMISNGIGPGIIQRKT
jgi:hypothetical protein